MDDAELTSRRAQTLGPTYRHFFERPLHLVRGRGCRLWDADGREYLDAYNNVASVGHCHPRVVEALARQAATLNTHTRYLHAAIVELAETLVERLPGGLDTCVFSCTGSEANDLAVQIARRVTGREAVLVAEASYHGVSWLTRQLSTGSYARAERPPWLGVFEPPNLYRGPYRYDDADAGQLYLGLARRELDRLEAEGYPPAALLVDLVWDSNGPLNPPADFLLGLAAEIRARGGLVIADEVQSGYCRGGRNWWMSDDFGLEPDLLTCGKPMGAGHPLALLATRREIAERYARHGHYFNTFGGNPVSAAVGKAVIRVIDEEGLLHNARDSGAYLEMGLHELARRHELIGDVQGRGLFWGLDLVSDRHHRFPLGEPEMRRLCSLVAEQGVITGNSGRYGQILKLRPPLCFARADADRCIEALDTALTRFEMTS